MINTGLLLRRSYESDYAAFRRFLVANRFESRAALKAELQPFGDGLKETPGQPWIAPRALRREMQFCQEHGIACQLPTPIDARAPLRNCPACAACCYHSALYQYPWARICPVHRQDIVASCPTCKQPWPRPSELIKRNCHRCSARVPLTRLTESVGFQEPTDTTCFQTVSSIISLWKSQKKISFYAEHAGENQYGNHYCIQPEDPNWPSLVAYDRPDWQAAFGAFGAPQEAVCEYIFDSEPAVKQTRRCRQNEARWENRLSRRFDVWLRERLRQRFGDAAADGADTFLFADRYSVAHVVYLSRINWKAVVREGRRNRRHLPYIAGGELLKKPDFGPPLSPCLLTRVEATVSKSPEQCSLSGDLPARQLPRQFQVWLYRCDLSWTFLTMLGYFDAVAAGSNKGWGWHKIFESMPPKASPLAWHRPRYFLGTTSDDQLCIRVPNKIVDPDFGHLPLQTEDI